MMGGAWNEERMAVQRLCLAIVKSGDAHAIAKLEDLARVRSGWQEGLLWARGRVEREKEKVNG